MYKYEEELKLALKEGETVKWKGLPAPYKVMDNDNKKSTAKFFIGAIVVAAALSLLYTYYGLQESNSTGIQPFVYIMTIGFPLIAFVDPIRDKMHINGQLLVITNQRILIFHKSNPTESKAISINLNDVDKVRIEEIEPGFNRIRFGAAAFGSRNMKLRRNAMLGAKDENDKPIAYDILSYFFPLLGMDYL